MIILMIRASDSSPPARGRRLRNWVIIWIRLIHPLLRGADACRVSLLYGFCDSSPPARGRHARNVTASPHFRFIPSCEGQTRLPYRGTAEPAIHPLLRGADSMVGKFRKRMNDSSPPARGRLHSGLNTRADTRFIPSCEGQTIIFFQIRVQRSIHPLLRGADAQCLCGFQPP